MAGFSDLGASGAGSSPVTNKSLEKLGEVIFNVLYLLFEILFLCKFYHMKPHSIITTIII